MPTQVIAVLRDKRTEISRQVHDTEKKLAKLRAALANLDAAMNILTPDHPDHVPGRRGYKRTNYFSRNELPRLVRDALREAAKPLAAAEIAGSCIAAKALPPSAHAAAVGSILTVLNILTRRREIVKSGTTRNAKWTVAAKGELV